MMFPGRGNWCVTRAGSPGDVTQAKKGRCIMATKKTTARKTASTKAKAEPKKLSQMAAAEKVLWFDAGA